jgi:hypothetical protein
MTDTIARLTERLRATTFRVVAQEDLQRDVALVLNDARTPFVRGYQFAGLDSPADFLLLGGTVLAVRVGGTLTATLRELSAFARQPDVTSVLLVSTWTPHRLVPTSLGSKPVYVVLVGQP